MDLLITDTQEVGIVTNICNGAIKDPLFLLVKPIPVPGRVTGYKSSGYVTMTNI
jgi:hypothetical protein